MQFSTPKLLQTVKKVIFSWFHNVLKLQKPFLSKFEVTFCIQTKSQGV